MSKKGMGTSCWGPEQVAEVQWYLLVYNPNWGTPHLVDAERAKNSSTTWPPDSGIGNAPCYQGHAPYNIFAGPFVNEQQIHVVRQYFGFFTFTTFLSTISINDTNT